LNPGSSTHSHYSKKPWAIIGNLVITFKNLLPLALSKLEKEHTKPFPIKSKSTIGINTTTQWHLLLFQAYSPILKT